MHALLALALVAAPGDIMLRVRSPDVTLSAGQRTTLGTGIAAQWPSVALADVAGFHAKRAALTGPVSCAVLRNETLDAATLFGLLVAGQTVFPGLSSTARTRWLDPELCVGGLLTAIGTLVAAMDTGATAARTLEFDCRRDGPTNVVCSVVWARSYSQAAAFTLFQTGATLVPLGQE